MSECDESGDQGISQGKWVWEWGDMMGKYRLVTTRDKGFSHALSCNAPSSSLAKDLCCVSLNNALLSFPVISPLLDV